MKLVIVESPGKTKTIAKYLGAGWQVLASFGHIRDLPTRELGVDLTSFEPSYGVTDDKKQVVARLKEAVKDADEVYLATDPDREGEAIAWHLQETLKLKNPKRITFAEITEKAIKQAIASPRTVDMNLVKAQEARRILDRLVGYPVSGALGNLLGKGKSAGRVQSPAVKIVVENERKIEAFKATTHYGVEATFEALDNIATGWKAQWKTKGFLPENEEYILSKDLAEKVASLKYFIVASFNDTESKQAPSAPFTTSSLQQLASKRLKISPKQTMDLAQKLYEGGHITYMRTDSPNLSADAIADIQEYCRANNLPVADKARTWKSKDGAQEAHEAIRPTHIELENAGETSEQQALYSLIRNQALASQMADAVFAVRKAVLQSEEKIEGKTVELESTGKTLVKAGWRTLTQGDEEEETETANNPIPALRVDSRLLVQSSKVQTKQTKPPARYTEATLVKQLENAGIGRPATYASILENIIKSKEYLTVDAKRNLLPTQAGYDVVDSLNPDFGFMNLDFTKDVEERFDGIAKGTNTYKAVVSNFYQGLDKELQAFKSKHNISTSNRTITEHKCPECKKPLILQSGKYKDGNAYEFFGCSGYPKCSFKADSDNGKPAPKEARVQQPSKYPITEHLCLKCKKPLYRKIGTSKTGKPFDFFGCSGYPKCNESYDPTANGTPNYEKKK